MSMLSSIGRPLALLFGRRPRGGLANEVKVKVNAAQLAFTTGSLIAERYLVRAVVGKGGYSVVYEIVDGYDDTTYALKTLRDDVAKDPETIELFRKEAWVWISLEPHPNIVRADFITELEGRLCIGMEFLPKNADGFSSLDGYLSSSPPDLEQSLRWMIQVCHGMEFARNHGIRCHRDIKPANILIDANRVAKLTDFGFAEVIDAARYADVKGRRKSVEQVGFGTPFYMSPEQFMNAPRCDERSDIYSLGVIMFQMAARGRLPFFPIGNADPNDRAKYWESMHEVHARGQIPHLASPMFPIIKRCLAKEPNGRYQQFRELRTDLEALLKTQSGKYEPPAIVKHPEAWEIYNRAYSLANLGDYESAVAQYDRSLEQDPSNADAWNNKGVCLRKIGRIPDSVECFERAIDLVSDHRAAHMNLGVTLRIMGKYREAIAWLEKCTKLDAMNETAWLNKALAQERLGFERDAVESFRVFLDLPPVALAKYVQHAKEYLANHPNAF
ncbi:MAG TPA: serine/threonine-protein kinase [Bacteroidota bacterium]|nr:serine/threonine-protein kinase [Bacteroidota bacterium]